MAAHALRAFPDDDLEVDEDEEDTDIDTAPRLADLSGRVVRVAQLIDMHVADPRRFLTWMRQDGWEPIPADQRPDDDPQDLVGAVMTATDVRPPLPGARPVTQTANAHLLDPDNGDELFDWSPRLVVIDFGGGW